jgi:hypothetical protein
MFGRNRLEQVAGCGMDACSSALVPHSQSPFEGGSSPQSSPEQICLAVGGNWARVIDARELERFALVLIGCVDRLGNPQAAQIG